uniref:TUB like protein 3 n=1 Tax=Cricetulus griseus TaxID=10029 RepID=A0A8C2M311_CRIGR
MEAARCAPGPRADSKKTIHKETCVV